jgi:glycerol dehydrogenase-like iron-containing ADH family enzyme
MMSSKDWIAHYGSGVVGDHCRDVGEYVVLTSPSAWRAVRPHLRNEPLAVEFITSQEEEYTQRLIEKLPAAEWTLGVGGGKALDASKIVSHAKRCRLLLIPTIVSTGSVFQATYPFRNEGKLVKVEETTAPEGVLFDTDIIRASPPHMNAAGMAECICWLGAVAAWQWWCERGMPGIPWDQSAADEAIEWVRDRVMQYAGDLDADGRPGERAIRICAEVNRERHELRLSKLRAHQRTLDHAFINAFLWANRWEPLHGEGVALGTLMNCHLYGSRFDEARSRLDACGTRYIPSQIGCTWEEVRAGMDLAEEMASSETILRHRKLDGASFRAMAERIDPEGAL